MSVSSSDIVFWSWIIALLVAIFSNAYAAIRGWKDGSDPATAKAKAVPWRRRKVVGVLCGAVGVVAAMLSFEKTVREIDEESRRYLTEQFLALKTETTLARAVACSGDQTDQARRNECFDFSNVDNMISFGVFSANQRSGQHFRKMTNWQRNLNLERNLRLDPLVEKVNTSIDRLNSAIDRAHEKALLSYEIRVFLGLFGLFLIIISLAISFGESVYQWRRESKQPPA